MSQPAPAVRTGTLVRWGMIGQAAYLFAQFFTLIGLTRFATVEEVGAFGLVSSIVIPVFFFFGLNMQVNFASSKQSDFAFRDFVALLALSSLVGYLVIVVIGLSAFSGQTRTLLLVIGAAKTAESFSQLSYGVFQRNDRMGIVAGSLILRGLSSTLVFLVVLWQGGGVVAAFIAQAAIWITLAVSLDLRLARRLVRATGDLAAPSGRRMRLLARSSFYLGLSGLLAAFQGSMPRYVIAGSLGVGALGYFTVVGYAMQAIATLVGSVTESLVARLSLYMSQDHGHALAATMFKLLAGLGGFAALGIGASLLIGDWVIEAVFGPSYQNLGGLLAIGLFAAALQGAVMTLHAYLLSARAFRKIMVIRIGTAIAMFLTCTLGAWLGGLPGVVWGMSATFAVQIVAMARPVRAIIRHHLARQA